MHSLLDSDDDDSMGEEESDEDSIDRMLQDAGDEKGEDLDSAGDESDPLGVWSGNEKEEDKSEKESKKDDADRKGDEAEADAPGPEQSPDVSPDKNAEPIQVECAPRDREGEDEQPAVCYEEETSGLVIL